MTTIEVDQLTKRYGRVSAVDHLTFHVPAAAVTGFLGPNGAGKTTTLRALLGLVTPTSGSARIGGVGYHDLGEPARVVGAVLGPDGVHPGRRARDHLRILAAAGRIDRRRVEQVLDLVGLADVAQRRVGTFSLGMRQRLGLAGALLGDPEVLVLDEPANGLDPEGIRWLRHVLRASADEGRTVLVSSHQLAEAAQTVDHVVVIDRGRHVASAPVGELAGIAGGGVHIRTPRPGALAEALQRAGYASSPEGAEGLVVRGATPEAIGPLVAAAGIVVHELRPHVPDLEAAFLALTERSPGGRS